MHLLHSCPIIAPQFASLSLLIKSNSNPDSNLVQMHGEMILVSSPLATMPQRTVLDGLSELHEHIASRLKNKNATGPSQTSNRNMNKPTKLSTNKNETMKGLPLNQPDILNTLQVYRGNHGIGLHYVVIQESDIVHFCSSLVMQASQIEPNENITQQSNSKQKRISASGKANKKGSAQGVSGYISNFSQNNATAAVLVLGLTGISYAYASNPLLNSLSTQMNEIFYKISRLRKRYTNLDEMRQQTKSLLSSLLFDDQDLQTNFMAGITFDTSATSAYSVRNESSLGANTVEKTNIEMKIMQILSISEKDMNLRIDRKISRSRSTDADENLRKKSSPDSPSLFGFDFKSDSSQIDETASSMKQRKSKSSFSISSEPKSIKQTNPLALHPSFLKTSSFDTRRRSSINSQRRRKADKNLNISKKVELSNESQRNPHKVVPSSPKSNFSMTASDWTANFNSFTLNDEASTEKSNIMKREETEEENVKVLEKEILTSPLHESQPHNLLERNMRDAYSIQPQSIISEKNQSSEKIIDGSSTSTVDTETPSEGTPPTLVLHISLNEDLMCSYEQGRLSTSSIEGTIQIKSKCDSLSPKPFVLIINDPLQHLKSIQETTENTRDISNDSNNFVSENDKDYKFLVKGQDLPADKYFTVLRYKCVNELRPVPIRVQSRTQVEGIFCRVALQISSNPANEDQLSELTILMPVPRNVRGETLITSPAGGIWNASKRSVLWRVSELGNGEKFQLQAQFEMLSEEESISLGYDETGFPSFPVLVRCQCVNAQLSQVDFEAHEASIDFPTDISMTKIRRFRLSHREKP